jgi:carbon storage regulator CsrA
MQESVVVAAARGCEQMVKVTVLEIRNGRVRLGFDASAEVPVHRAEVWERICAENGRLGFPSGSPDMVDV